MNARGATVCSCLVTLTALAWLVSVRLTWPDPALEFIHPKAAIVRAGSEFPVQLRRAELDPDDRELQVGVYCEGEKVDGFIVQIDEYSPNTLPSVKPRFIWSREVCRYHLAAVVVAVKDGRTVGRARAVKTVDAR